MVQTNPAVLAAQNVMKAADASVKNLFKAIESGEKALTEFTTLSETIELKKVELANIEKEVETATLDAEVELARRVRANEENTLSALMIEYGKADVDMTTYTAVLTENEVLKQEQETAISNEIAKVTAIQDARHKNEMSTFKLTIERDNASRDAELESKDKEIAMLREQLDAANDQLAANREAFVKVQTEATAPSFNISK
jgi:hypothetical protein